MPYQRDPVSQLFDAGSARLLARAHARPGQWVATRITPPPARTVAWAASRGINLAEPDPTARSRWVRAFIRSAYYQNTWYVRDGRVSRERRMAKNSRAIRYEVGRLYYARGAGVGWRVRVMVVDGGARGYGRVPEARSYVRDPAVRSVPADRDWDYDS
jgi:hypothetical protein